MTIPSAGRSLLFCVVVLGCATTRSIPFDNAPLEAKPEGHEVVLLDAGNIQISCQVIGVVEANAGKAHSSHYTIRLLKEEARKMGGDR